MGGRSRHPTDCRPELKAMDDTSRSAKVKTAASLPFISLFELPKLQVPAALREISDKSAAQVKDACDKARVASESATDLIEETYAIGAKGAVDYNLKLFAAVRANVDAAFDFTSELASVTSFSEAIEISTARARTRLEALTEQARELAGAAQKLGADTVHPINTGIARMLSKVA
jgi:phasin